MDKRLTSLTTAQCVAIVAILFAATALRLWWNNVAAYSPADETVYARYTETLTTRSFVGAYPEIVRAFLEEPRRWRYPSPIRWGYFALATVAAKMYGNAEPAALAWLSTIASIVVVPLLFLVALRRFGARAALLAAAFVAVSPIELALGRRALQDEVFCAAVLLAFLLFDIAIDRPGWIASIAAVVAMTLAFGVKESFLYLMPAFVAYALFRGCKPFILLIPPVLYFATFAVLAHSTTAFFRIGQILTAAMKAPYVLQYQGGPPHRLLFDFLVAAPLVSILAAAAVVLVLLGHARGGDERALVAFVVVAIALLAIVPSKNLRFWVMLDPMVRLLAAWVVASRATPIVAGIAAANAAIELELFHTIFIRGDVYDPVTQPLLEALGAVPHAQAAHQFLFPWICAAIAAIAWITERSRRSKAPRLAHPDASP